MRRLAAVVVLVLMAGPSLAQTPAAESRLFRGLGIAYLALASADTAQTAYAAGSGRAREVNPLIAPIADHPVALGTVKILVPVYLNWGTSRGYRTRPRMAVGMRIMLVGVQGFVVAWNARQLHQARQR